MTPGHESGQSGSVVGALAAVAEDEVRDPLTPTKRQRRLKINVWGISFIVALIALWEILVDTHVVTLIILPAPHAIAAAAGQLAQNGTIGGPLLHTLGVTIVGWIISSVIGLLVGVAIAEFRILWTFSMASIDVVRAIPAIAFVPLIVTIFGFTSNTEYALVLYVSIWPVLIAVLSGVQTTRQAHHDVARMMHLSRVQTAWKITLPGAFPQIVVGLRVGMAAALTLTVVAELIANPKGLGYQLYFNEESLHPDRMFVYVILIGILGYLLNLAIVGLARISMPGMRGLGGGEAA